MSNYEICKKCAYKFCDSCFYANNTCAHCGEFDISDDSERAADQLCDRCWNEIQVDNGFIGYGKGE